MSNLREDFGELYSQVNELYVDETKQKISEVISVLIDEGYSDSAITCYFESQDDLNIVEKYTSITESYEIPEQNIDRVSSLYQEGWAGRLAKNLIKHGKEIGKGAKKFVTGGKKVASEVGDDVVKATSKTSKGNTVTGSNWKSGANPSGKPEAPKVNDSLGRQIKDTATAAKKGIKNNPWGVGAAGAIGAGIGLGAITGGEDANKKAMEKLKKDKAELDKQLKGDGTTPPNIAKEAKPKEPPKSVPPLVGEKEKKVEKPKTVAPEKKKPNVPDGIARGITGAMDIATGNMTDFDQRGGKPFGLARVVTGIADKLTGDRFDFDKRGASKLNAGQKAERDKNYVKKSETPKQTTPTPAPDKKTETKKDTGLSFADAIKLASQLSKQPKSEPKPTNPSGKVLPKPNEVKKGSTRERMINKNVEIHGADKISKLRNKNAAFQAAKKKGSGYSMDDFVKDFPNSNTAKERRKSKRVTSVMDMESYDAFDIILSYLKETQQADSLDEALYVMTEMDAQTIQGIVGDFKKKNLAEEEADRVKDRRLEKYGIGHDGSDRNAGSSSSSSSGNRPKGKTVLQKETEKKYGKGKSAVDIVRAKIKAKHGSGAIAPSKTTQKATTKAQKSADQDGDGKVRTVDA